MSNCVFLLWLCSFSSLFLLFSPFELFLVEPMKQWSKAVVQLYSWCETSTWRSISWLSIPFPLKCFSILGEIAADHLWLRLFFCRLSAITLISMCILMSVSTYLDNYVSILSFEVGKSDSSNTALLLWLLTILNPLHFHMTWLVY